MVPPLVTWSLLFLVATVLGGLGLSYRYLDDLARGHAGTFPQRLVVQITRLYLDLMHKRFEEKLRVSYAVDPALGRCLVPQLILQPLIENSLRHAWAAPAPPIVGLARPPCAQSTPGAVVP